MKTLICELDNALSKTALTEELFTHQLRVSFANKFRAISGHKLSTNYHPNAESYDFQLPLNRAIEKLIIEKKRAGYRIIIVSNNWNNIIEELPRHHSSLEGATFTKSIPTDLNSFEYLGTKKTDVKTWKTATKCYVVEHDTEVSSQLLSVGVKIEGSFQSTHWKPTTILAAIRPTQWLKNCLVFVPLITSQQLMNISTVSNSILMFFCFCLVASFGYIVNDLLDIQSDRAHSIKRNRPFAAGELSATQGTAIGAVILLLAATGSLFLPSSAILALLSYLLLTVVYSAYLKTKIMMDVVALGALFTLRVVGGAEAIQSELSFYLLSFSIFLFASLGLIKRYAELLNLEKRGRLNVKGRGYQVEDIAPVRIIGISMGYMSVFILGQYINSPVVTQYYDNPKFIWLLFPLLMFWLGRLWILANRGEVNEDPLIFTVKDSTSRLVLVTAAIILILAN